MIKVESNKALPLKRRGVPGKYPWKDLKVGDSFFIEGRDKKNGIYSCLASFNKRNAEEAIKITIRMEPKGVRVWRIA